MSLIPVPGSAPAASARPKATDAPDKKYWRFTLRYWQQAKNYGVGAEQGSWFIALLNRLSDLGNCLLEDVMGNIDVKDALRIHPIDWQAKACVTSVDDLDWVPKHYLENPEEYPIMQIHISKALGRIVGFFDQDQVFNIILLDPKHNLQPSKFNGYKIRPTRIGEDEVTRIRAQYERAITKMSGLSDDVRRELLAAVCRQEDEDHLVVVMRLSANQAAYIDECVALRDDIDAGSFLVRSVEHFTLA